MSKISFASPIRQVDEALAADTDSGLAGSNAVFNVANVHYEGSEIEGDFAIDDAYTDVSTIAGMKAGIYLVSLNFTLKPPIANQVFDFKIIGGTSSPDPVRSITSVTSSSNPQNVSLSFIIEVGSDDTTLTFQAQNDPAGTGAIDGTQFSFVAVKLYALSGDAIYS